MDEENWDRQTAAGQHRSQRKAFLLARIATTNDRYCIYRGAFG